MNNLPDLIFLPLNWNSTDFSRVTRLAEKKKVVAVNTVKYVSRFSLDRKKKVADSLNLYLDV